MARWLFAARGRLPRALMDFLDDGVRTEVLRRSGAGYRIRHQELADHLRRRV